MRLDRKQLWAVLRTCELFQSKASCTHSGPDPLPTRKLSAVEQGGLALGVSHINENPAKLASSPIPLRVSYLDQYFQKNVFF